jgi:TfuA protein
MRDRPVVYLGPSLPRAEAQRLLDAEFRPPIRRGDLTSLRRTSTVVIIDGEFGQSLSVSPKEILRLLDGGVRVIGASSMGALRAAELAPCGMEGCGWVFDAYRSGRIVGDDEVALTFSPVDGTALTVPLVNVRCWLERLRLGGRLDARTSTMLLRRARGIFFADRVPARLVEALEAGLGRERVHSLLEETGGITDIKADDARRALVQASTPRGERPREPEGRPHDGGQRRRF